MTSIYPVLLNRKGRRAEGASQNTEPDGLLPNPQVAWLDALAPMRATAVRVLTQHVSGEGRCLVCGSAWPCDRAVLAEHNLAAQ